MNGRTSTRPKSTSRQLAARVLALSAICMALAGAAASQALGVGGAVTSFGGRGIEAGKLASPSQLAINRTGSGGVAAGDVYVADAGNDRVQEFSASGEFVRTFGWDVVRSGPDNNGANEQQSVTVPASVTGGSFQLTVTSATGSPSFKAGLTEIRVETESGVFQVGDALSGQGIAPGTTISAVAAHTLTLSQATTGSNNPSGNEFAGILTATETTAPVPYNASAAQLAGALEALAAIGPGGATVTGGPGASAPFLVTFSGGSLAHNDVAPMSAASLLTGGSAGVTTTSPGGGPEVCEAAGACGPGAEGNVAAGSVSKPQGLAIDQTNGNVYVTDGKALRVDVFSATGAFEGGFGWNVKAVGGTEELQFCTLASGCKAGSSGSGAGQMVNLATTNGEVGYAAVSPLNGHLLVANKSSRRVDEFAPMLTGETVTGVSFVRGYGWGAKNGAAEFQICTTTCHVPTPEICTSSCVVPKGEGSFDRDAPEGVAVDAAGKVYATDSRNNRVQTFDPEGHILGNFAPGALNASEYSAPNTVSVNPASGNIVVLAFAPKGGRHPLKFDAGGNLLETYIASNTLAGDANSLEEGEGGSLYLVRANTIYTLGTIISPEAEIESINASGGTSAEIKAKINPVGLEGTYRLEFSTDGGLSWSLKASGEFPNDNADHQITVTVNGLIALSEYQIRIVAEKVFASGKAEDTKPFNTPAAPPLIDSSGYAGNTDSCVELKGSINPENQEATYAFEYVTEAQFTQDGFVQAKSAPATPASVPAGSQSVAVAQELCGLTPRTTYHFRLTAQNTAGPSTGEAATFTTFTTAASGLSDARVYEQASPVDKNATNVQAGVNSLQASRNGDAVTFFSNAGLPGGEGAQDFPIFMARRNPDGSGWSTQGLMPPASAGTSGFVNGWSEDLNHAYASAWVLGAPASLFDRDTAARSVRPVATEPEVAGNGPAFAGTTEDDSAVLFEDAAQITPGAVSGKPNVYLWNATTDSTVLAAVMNDGQAPTEGAFAGPYDWFHGKTTEGGARAGYYTYETNALSRDASHLYFTAAGTGQLYIRNNPLAPQSALDGEGNCTEAAKACTVRVSRSRRAIPDTEHPAVFLGATADGSKALFSSTSSLTNNANTGPEGKGRDLYLYDAASDTLEDLTPQEGANGAEFRGMLGYSADLSSIYFAANGVLAPGASPGSCPDATEVPAGPCSLYLLHNGTITFIARLWGTGAPQDVRDWAPTTIGSGGQSEQRSARVTPDGKTLLFRSKQKLTSYDNKGKPELYRYSAEDDQLGCVSCNPTGTPPSGGTGISNIVPGFTEPARQAPVSIRNLSTSGDRLFFDTPDKLLSTDTNGVNDVYEWEAKGEGSCESEAEDGGCLYLISSGTSPVPSYFVDASASGSDVFILTSQPLVGQDKDELTDVYDARIGGGIAAQNPPTVPVCEGEACRSATTTAPQLASPGSASFSGPSNSSRSHAKKHRKHKKKSHKKHAKQKRRAHR